MKKRRKTYSFDAMIRFFLHYYNIPTKQDIDRLLKRMDRLEEAVKAVKVAPGTTTKPGPKKKAGGKRQAASALSKKMTATDTVLAILKRSSKEMDVAKLKEKSGFADKKLRNIIFRLTRQGAIKRVGRGMYAIR